MSTVSKFEKIVKNLEKKYLELKSMKAISILEIKECPKGGVYTFIQNGKTLYVGRTRRLINVRLKGHIYGNDCPFAFKIAREKSGYTLTDYRNLTRKKLLTIKKFRNEYIKARCLIKELKVKYVFEDDPVKQALLEIYISYRTKSPYNEFKTS